MGLFNDGRLSQIKKIYESLTDLHRVASERHNETVSNWLCKIGLETVLVSIRFIKRGGKSHQNVHSCLLFCKSKPKNVQISIGLYIYKLSVILCVKKLKYRVIGE